MTDSIMSNISSQYRKTHEYLLSLVDGLSDENIRWTPNSTTPSVGFHVWHLARWADYLQEQINGRGSQLWEKEGIGAQWELETNTLGLAETGSYMDDNAATTLRVPSKGALLDYARRVFAASQQAVSTITDLDFYRVYEDLHGENWHEGHIGPIIVAWIEHDSRHLGMIECLVGVQGMHGSAEG